MDQPNQQTQDKQVNLITQSKGQLEASINKVLPYLTDDEFRDYNDAIYTAVGYMQLILKRIKGENTDFVPTNKEEDESSI